MAPKENREDSRGKAWTVSRKSSQFQCDQELQNYSSRRKISTEKNTYSNN